MMLNLELQQKSEINMGEGGSSECSDHIIKTIPITCMSNSLKSDHGSNMDCSKEIHTIHHVGNGPEFGGQINNYFDNFESRPRTMSQHSPRNEFQNQVQEDMDMAE